MSFLDNTGLAYFYSKLKEKFIRSINSQIPDENGNVAITNVATADNLTAPDAQGSYDNFIYRSSGGSASIANGEAQLLYIDGNMKISGRVEENFHIDSTNDISVTYNASIWRNWTSTSGTYIFNYVRPNSSSAVTSPWMPSGTWEYGSTTTDSLDNYGLYVSNIKNPSININVESSSITSVTIVPSTWSEQVNDGGFYTFNYDQPDNESANWYYNNEIVTLATYGITVNGTAGLGDTISVTYEAGTPNSTVTVTYTAPEQGTITIATPTSFSATGFNQFDKETMYIADATISNGVIIANSGTYVCYCKAVGGVTNGYGAYSKSGKISDIGWCASLPALGSTVVTTGSTINSTLSQVEFNNDGYVVVVVSNMDDLMIHPRWSGDADDVKYTAYVAPSVITFPTEDIEGTTIPIGDYGMPAVGTVADRLNLDAGTYIKRIGRLENTVQNKNEVDRLGVAYQYDANWIYYVLLPKDQVTYTVECSHTYMVDDHGTEEFIGTSVAVGAQILYGQNLRDKLRTDVLTISEQNPALSDSQLKQICKNLKLLDIIYPVGSIYMSVNNTNPGNFLGGSWERIKGCFLLAATDGGASGGNSNASIAPGGMGGEATHTLTVTEMPSHNHSYPYLVAASGTGGTNRRYIQNGETANTGSKGGGAAHNNMPPYLAVYVWKRTA